MLRDTAKIDLKSSARWKIRCVLRGLIIVINEIPFSGRTVIRGLILRFNCFVLRVSSRQFEVIVIDEQSLRLTSDLLGVIWHSSILPERFSNRLITLTSCNTVRDSLVWKHWRVFHAIS